MKRYILILILYLSVFSGNALAQCTIVRTIAGPATVCEGSTGNVYTTETGMTEYAWSVSAGGTITAGGSATENTVTVTWTTGGARTVSVNYKDTNDCTSTSPTVFNVTVNSLPGAAGAITGTATICQGSSFISYSVASIANATGYSWSYNGTGATITGTTESITINFSASATGGDLTVYGTNPCGNGTTSTPFTITVNPLPVAAGSVTGTASVCVGRTGVSYSVPAIANATGYSWFFSGTGATIVGSTQAITINFSESATSGTLTVHGINSCGNGTASTPYLITVNPRPAPSISGPDRACITSAGNLYAVAPGMSGYDWDVSSDGTITGGGGPTNSSVTVTWNDNGPQTIRVNYIDGNGCTATSQTIYNVTVIDKPFPTNVQFTGVLRDFATLTASYNYIQDVCFPEVPSETEISWYRANNSGGSASQLITTKPGTDKTLVLSGSELGKYIKIKVRLSDGATLMSAVWSSDWLGPVVANEKPAALGVSVTGTLLFNNTLDGNYTYTDAEFDPEGATTFQWFRANDGSGSGSSVITGATSQSYLLTTGDRNKFIRFRVTPKAQNGATPGDAVNSAWVGPVSDNPPVATLVTIGGAARVGTVLTGNYQYTDVDGDVQGSSIFQWYTGTSSSGAGSAAIGGATSTSLLLSNSILGSYIGFSVTPVAQQGISPGAIVTTTTWIGPVFNDPPVATIQPVTGSLDVNGLLTGHYVYSDVEGDIESGTLIQWYSSSTSTGIYTLITGETGIAHIIKNNEQGRYFKIRITPVAATGGVKTGAWVESPAFGPANSQPTASNVIITGTAEVGATLTGSYDWDDADPADLQGTSTFRWLRNGTIPIPGATGQNYVVTADDEGYKISFEITPVSLTGYPSAGTPVQSSQTTNVLDNSPLTPVVSQVCVEGIRTAGHILRGKYYYDFYKSEGTSTYQWYRNGVAISGATGIQYTLQQVADIDSNADITFEVTPKSSNIPAKVGAIVASRPLARIIMPKDQYSVSESDVTLSSNVIDLGGVFSGTGVTGTTFSPKTAGSAGSPYTISYLLNIVKPAHNCSQQAAKVVAVNPNVSSFVGFNMLYCHDSGEDIVTVTGVPIGSIIIGFTSTDNDGIVSQSGTTVTLDPGRMRPGINKDFLFFSYNYLGNFYQICDTFKIDSVSTNLRILNLKEAYCQGDPKEYISIENLYPLGGTATWTGDFLSDTKAGSAYADPFLGVPGSSYPVSYQYKSQNGCYSAILRDTVKINPLPEAFFPLNPTYNIDGGAIALVPVQTGGTFSGNGVSGEKMFPDIAGLGEHEIKYVITDANQCSADTSRKTTIRKAQGTFTGIPSIICYSDTIFNVMVTGLPTVGVVTATGFSNFRNTLVYTPGDTEADYNVPAAGEGFDTLFFSYNWDGVGYSISKAINVDSLGQVTLDLTPGQKICNNYGLIKLHALPSSGIFSGPVLGDYLDPTMETGSTAVSYTYTNKETGCSINTTIPVIIYPAPAVHFAPDDICINDDSDTTKFRNNTKTADPVDSWLWQFTDAGVPYPDSSKNARHLYKTGGWQKISLKATTINGCSATLDTTVNLGRRPDADFTWKNDCMHSGDSIILKDKTVSASPILSRSWSLFPGAEFSTADLEARYPKTDTGYLSIRYIVRTSYANCNDTVIKDIYIRPAITILADGYFEDFESGKGGWIKGENTDNTWSFGLPDRGTINTAYSGQNAWFTDFSPSGINKENSSIESPCFDFTTSERPEISFWNWKIFTRDIDGAVLQFRIGVSDEWHTVGAIDDGIEWYNSAVIRGKPGDNQMGWTTRGDPDKAWTKSIHTLDEIQGETDVVFRIAYGSDGSQMENDGIAFDDIRIGERSRNILLEHFTNIQDLSGFNADMLVNTIVKNRHEDVINIQYHTNFPGTDDPYYIANPGDAGARILFYGLTKAPYSFIDGGTDDDNFASYYSYSNNNSKIDSNYVIKRSLIPSRFDITLTTNVFGKILTITPKLTALENIINSENLTLFLAVTEKKNTIRVDGADKEFWNIFRKFIPDAGGILLKSSWTKGESISLAEQSWTIDKLLNNSDIEVIAFIQNTITKEVYQAFSVIHLNIVVGMENPRSSKGIDFAIFPNPVVNRLTIEFGEPLQDETDICIYDMQGVPVLKYIAESGLNYYIIDNLKLKQGLYMVRISHKGIDLGSRKLVVAGR
jgi:hypothetical protein